MLRQPPRSFFPSIINTVIVRQSDNYPVTPVPAAPLIMDEATPAMAMAMKDIILELSKLRRPDLIMYNPNSCALMVQMSSFNTSRLNDSHLYDIPFSGLDLNDALIHGIHSYLKEQHLNAQMENMRRPGLEPLVKKLFSEDLIKLGCEPKPVASVGEMVNMTFFASVIE
jgi:hypothetical protein